MSTYNVARAKHATLVLNVVDTINFSVPFAYIRVTNRSGLGAIWARADGTNPGVLADDSYLIDNNESKDIAVADVSSTHVKIVCAAAAVYSVEGV